MEGPELGRRGHLVSSPTQNEGGNANAAQQGTASNASRCGITRHIGGDGSLGLTSQTRPEAFLSTHPAS